MATQVQQRRGTTAEHSTFTGAVGELTVDTDKDTAVVHDGSTSGGAPLLREDLSNLPAGTIDNADINASAAIAGTKISPDFGSQNVTTTGTATAGKVGVGTTPGATTRLHVKSGANDNNPVLRLEAATDNNLDFRQTGSVFDINVTAGDPLSFSIGSSEKARIDSSGRLGLGTSAPLRSLHIAGAGDTGLMLQTTNAVDDKEIWEIQVAGDASNHANLIFRSRTNAGTGGTEALRITNDGKVGIGTTSPQETLHVSGTSSDFCVDTDDSTLRFGSYGEHDIVLVTGRNTATGSSRVHIENGDGESFRVDSSNRLLVGTSTARSDFYNTTSNTAKFQIEGTDSTTRASIVRNENGTGGPQLILAKSRGSSNGADTLVLDDDTLGIISFQGADGSEMVESARIFVEVDNTPGANDMPGRLVFSTTADGASSPTANMLIDRTGRCHVMSSGNGLVSSTTQGAGTTYQLFTGVHSRSTVTTGGTGSIIIYSNGNVVNTNNSYGAISDIKLKENIVDASSQWSDLKALQVRNYNFKEGQTHTQIGLIAQEVELVSPGLVSESPDRDAEGNDLGTVTKSVNYSVLYMKAVKALQEAMERIEVLEAKVNALEGN